MIRRLPRRLIGWLVWPPSRAVAVLLAWSHRQTVAMWWRSLAAEVQRRPFDPKRLVALVRTLWKASTDPRLRGLGGIRSLSVDTDPLDGADQSYRTATVRATLLDVPGVVSVEINDSTDTTPVTEPADLPGMVEPV